MSNFKAGAFFNEGNIVEVGLRNPDASADGDGGLYARDVIRGVELPGGGGGDFSTAEVTILIDQSAPTQDSLDLDNVLNTESGLITTNENVNGEAGVRTIVLYQNSPIYVAEDAIVSASGNIRYDEDEAGYFINGDCTITAKAFAFS